MLTIYGIESCSTCREARKWLIEHPTLVKRPVLEKGKQLALGFSARQYAEVLGKG